MGNKKSKLTIILIIAATIILAGVAVFTALKLYKLNKQSDSPTSPENADAGFNPSTGTVTQECRLRTGEAFTIRLDTVSENPACNATMTSSTQCVINNVSRYGATYEIVATGNLVANQSIVLKVGSAAYWCPEACGHVSTTDPSFTNVCQKNENRQYHNVTLGPGNNFRTTIYIENSSPSGAACGSFQTDAWLKSIANCPEFTPPDDSLGGSGSFPMDTSICYTGNSCGTTPTVTTILTPTNTPINTPTGTRTPTATSTVTNTPINTATPIPTLPPNLAACADLVFTIAGPTGSPTNTPTATLTSTPTNTPLVTNTNTPTPTVPASCNNSCSSDSSCQSGLTCSGGSCRNPSCTSQTNCTCVTPTPLASCSNSCSNNSDCASGLICSGSMCRNQSCTGESDCVCNTATNTSTPTPTAAGVTLPQAGVSTLTYIFGFVSLSTIMIALLIAL